ncbi:hypothetical protein [Marinobacterium arenosum]|uniref:hypothetical protein n=1 Tax=Marinobacterium arenosum TaxID=2862496 RepID=UPI001C954608|nr:hypothetical protein [Marinobacterium arenosum]MBY4677954.1 hypothetical protein [Marinobacterium arenosum]
MNIIPALLMAVPLALAALTGCTGMPADMDVAVKEKPYLPVKEVPRASPQVLAERVKSTSASMEAPVPSRPKVNCQVFPGSLKHNLEQIARDNSGTLVWLAQGDLMVDLAAEITAESYHDCVSIIVTAFQKEGATISAIERDNAILIRER